jgi:hypothetical protein
VLRAIHYLSHSLTPFSSHPSLSFLSSSHFFSPSITKLLTHPYSILSLSLSLSPSIPKLLTQHTQTAHSSPLLPPAHAGFNNDKACMEASPLRRRYILS